MHANTGYQNGNEGNAHLVVVVTGDDVPRHASEGVRGVHGVPGVREPVAVIVALDTYKKARKDK